MSIQSIFAAHLFNGNEVLRDQQILITDGVISQIKSAKRAASDLYFPHLTSAGLIDTQVNGGGGFLFNQVPTVDTLKTMLRAHAQFGTTRLFPTVITDSFEVMRDCANALSKAISLGMQGILGIHFEGPHLASAKKGIHPHAHIRPIDAHTMALFLRKDLGQVIVTVAPESVSAQDISKLVNAGVVVSIGHSNATFEQTQSALTAGVTGFTHLYNAMSGISGREPGVLGAALQAPQTYCGIIADLHHVHPANVKLALQAKGNEHMMLVSDSMSHVGAQDCELVFNGEKIIKLGDKLSLKDGTLAGSALDMITAVKNMHQAVGADKYHALNMASSVPAHFTHCQARLGSIEVGKHADFIHLNDAFEVLHTVCKGELIFTR